MKRNGTCRRYLVPYIHLDTQWRWSVRTTITQYLPQTLMRNFDLFETYPKYSINVTGAYRYRLIKEYYPKEYERLKEYIQQGRWIPSGSLWEESDTVLPSCESLIRNILYGRMFFEKEFSTQTDDILLPDSFGFPSELPTVLTHCRIAGFSTQKLSWDPVSPIPFGVGVWQGADGASLICALKPGAYVSRFLLPPRCHRSRSQESISYSYYGSGDIGGAPDEHTIRQVIRAIGSKHSGCTDGPSDLMYKSLSKEEVLALPRYTGELLLTKHSAGSLSSKRFIKRLNATGEQAALLSESINTMAALQVHHRYPDSQLRSSYQMLIENQMHDIITGTCVPEACQISENDGLLLIKRFEDCTEDAVAALSKQLPLRKDQQALFIYNPSCHPRRELIEFKAPWSPTLHDGSGLQLETQTLFQEGAATYLFEADIPPCGWRSYICSEAKESVEPEPQRDTPETVIPPSSLENDLLEVHVDADGWINSIIDKRSSCQILAGPLRYELHKERPHTFPAWNMDWKDRKTPELSVPFVLENIQLENSGPLRSTMVVTHSFGSSRSVRRISIDHVANRRAIHVTDTIDWHESGCSLKLNIRVPAGTMEKAIYGMELDQQYRGKNTQNQYEFPSKGWIALETDEGHTLTFIHRDIYGSDRPDSQTVRPTLLFTPGRSWRTVTFLDQTSQDWGRHTLEYMISIQEGAWTQSDLNTLSSSFKQKLKPYLVTRVARALRNHMEYPLESSLLSLSSESCHLIALKQSEADPSRFIVRLKKPDGPGREEVEMRFSLPVKDAYEADGCELPLNSVMISGKSIFFPMDLYSLKTFSIKLVRPEVADSVEPHLRVTRTDPEVPQLFERTGQSAHEDREVNPGTTAGSFQQLSFRMNSILCTSDESRGAIGTMTFPLEQIPEEVHIGELSFCIKRQEGFDALSCGGEQIEVPENFIQESIDLHMLICAESETEATFICKDTSGAEIEQRLSIPGYQGLIGRSDTRIWKRSQKRERDYLWLNSVTGIDPGFLRPERVAIHTTHMHGRGLDLPYQYGYIFHHRIELPPMTARILLPEDARIKLFGLLVHRPVTRVEPAYVHHGFLDV